MPKLTPRGTDFIDSASTQIKTDITVNATPEEVWAVLTDNERWPEWFAAAKECRTTSQGVEGVGAGRWIHIDLFKVNERFVAWDPPHRWAFTILEANLPGIISVVEQALLQPTGDGQTVVTYVMAADLGRIFISDAGDHPSVRMRVVRHHRNRAVGGQCVELSGRHKHVVVVRATAGPVRPVLRIIDGTLRNGDHVIVGV